MVEDTTYVGIAASEIAQAVQATDLRYLEERDAQDRVGTAYPRKANGVAFHNVIPRMRKSRDRLQWSTYQTSSANFFSQGRSLRPFT